MPLIITKTLISTFPSIVGDYYTDLDEETQKDYIPSVYEGLEYELNIKFEYEDEFEVPVPIYEAYVTTQYTGYDVSKYGVTVSKISADTFKIKGSLSNVIPGAYYNFVMRDGSIKQLPADTSEDYRAIIQYKMPPQPYETIKIQWSVQFFDGSSLYGMFPQITQYVYWVFSSARDNLKTLVASRQ